MLATIAKLIAQALLPIIAKQIADEFGKHVEPLTKALVTAVTEAAATGAERGADKLTDYIPGTLDDQIIDPIVKRGLEIFRGLTR
ncbi:hypothetical protein SEA_POTATOSPLIT_11 [Mycobacterium phage PotatoSplit]|uniref:Uncharacterized protein n=14 Tax=Microwolfvirus TaxID=2942894 RepID=R4JNA5_BPMB2|nr:hypothetical protein PBI_BXZ2_10 [Mycobacterium phage Bxz2]YP_009219071.1 hypothetical protein AVV42_gp93 [Mycobacterium phage Anubis]AEK07672.1 hypothetical protein VIX_10 [Mycobacterium phage Vix]AGK87211.1 hypothetical protein PBI_METHUSELAH_10 [Mycobacterium phage Methuselah]AJA41793.1 hypothetical protein PBI_SPIKE509_10 [Mycobacterium phage Spike509]AJA41884.1 hypothetical protein PBI_PHOXY_10 [Mycobacterium phage Phoxy]ANU78992.1 hypothetical protein SEA_PENNY1_10 [Mycobacterium pha